jgi:hypothetical protein
VESPGAQQQSWSSDIRCTFRNQLVVVVLPRENLQLRPRQRRQKCWRSEVTPGLLAGAEPEAHQI